LVKASMSLGRPGTAAEIILFEPRADLTSERSLGYASISQVFCEFGIFL